MLTVTHKIRVSAPRSFAAEYLHDLTHLAAYEPKVKVCEASYPDPKTGVAQVEGEFMGLPWRGTFQMEFSEDGGFQSRMTEGPLAGRMMGGFSVKEVPGGVIVHHFESYGFPFYLRPLQGLIRRWVFSSMEKELYLVKEGIEMLHRQSMLTRENQEVRHG